MTIEQDDVIRIIRILDESDFDELHLEMGDLKMTVAKNRAGGTADNSNPLPLAQAKQSYAQAPVQAKQTPPATGTEPAAPLTGQEALVHPASADELIPIKSPLLGTFYLSPKPGAPPFVSIGSRITEEDTVCLIEVMKTFTTVKSGVKGRIVSIGSENARMVEYQQTLFLVEPETGAAQ